MNKYKFCDIIRRPIDNYTDHYGVYIGKKDNEEIVFELNSLDNSNKAICRYITLDEFEDRQKSVLVPVKKDETAKIKLRLKELIELSNKGEIDYSVSGGVDGWNCEEAARYIVQGKRVSAQVQAEQQTHGIQKASIFSGCGGLALIVVGVGLSLLWPRKYNEEKNDAENRINKL